MEQGVNIIKLKRIDKILLYCVISLCLYSETYLGIFQISLIELFAKVVKKVRKQASKQGRKEGRKEVST